MAKLRWYVVVGHDVRTGLLSTVYGPFTRADALHISATLRKRPSKRAWQVTELRSHFAQALATPEGLGHGKR